MTIRLLPLGGFLGGGKTTTIVRAAQALQARGERVAVITNDQGEDLVDTRTVRDAIGGAVGEVTGGCFCCRFEDLAAVVGELARTSAPNVVLAEAVGSCTDLQSTVVRPLRALLGDRLSVAPLTVVVDPDRYTALRPLFGAHGDDATDLAHLYHHQLAEADVLALNKLDLRPPAERSRLIAELASRFPGRRVIGYSARTGEGADELLRLWATGSPDEPWHPPFAVDYDRYGAAEAELAWTNQVYEVTGPVIPDEWLAETLTHLAQRIRAADATVGHVKVRVVTARGSAKGSLLDSHGPIRRDESFPALADEATALVNARVGADPAMLAAMVRDAVDAADTGCATTSRRVRGEVFRPGYPVPRHRM